MGMLKSLTDGELVKLLTAGDLAAIEEVYMRYWEKLYLHASRLLRDEAVAEDLVHDLFAYLIDHGSHLEINGPLNTYLYRAVRNRVINEFHKSKSRLKYIDSLKSLSGKGVNATDQLILEKEMQQRIEQAVAALPGKTREAFLLSRKEELSRKEIAEATGTSESTVNNQINKALKVLRAKLYSLFF
jgi:RNA polymerase sigma-70 factor (ECF subfamily)